MIMLELFEDFSGLAANYSKYLFIPFSLLVEETSGMAIELKTPIGSLPLNCLGLPLSEGQIISSGWNQIINRMEIRLENWKAKLLSRGGLLVQLNSSSWPCLRTSCWFSGCPEKL